MAEIEAEDVEEIEQAVELVERVAAIDIAKASGMVCIRLPHEDRPGFRTQRVFSTVATSGAILDLADHLICQGVTRVVMEATSTYWKPFFFLLESRGLECWLVNARDVKNVPGGPRPTRLTRCGWPRSPNGACAGRRWFTPNPSASCVT
jgi:hypothetical protein